MFCFDCDLVGIDEKVILPVSRAFQLEFPADFQTEPRRLGLMQKCQTLCRQAKIRIPHVQTIARSVSSSP